MHCGYINSITGVPRNTVSEALVIVEYAASAKFYPSVYRNGIRSRAWGFHENGYAYRVSSAKDTFQEAGQLLVKGRIKLRL